LNLLPATNGRVLMSASEGGLQHFYAGARANVGIKSGRYMFEARILENHTQTDLMTAVKGAVPRNILRVGFSTSGVFPLIGDTEDSIAFDSEGYMLFNGDRMKVVTKKFEALTSMAVVLNVQEGMPNNLTVSVFYNGVRVAEPQPLPEQMVGLTLYPTVSFRGVNVDVNFGPPLSPLPFKCRTLSDASKEDVVEISHDQPADGLYEAVFPVFLPDEGTFDWADWLVSEHPGKFTEISDRAIAKWARRSGLVTKTTTTSATVSNDRPDMEFGVAHISDGTVKKALMTFGSIQERNLLIMEVKGNLLKSERSDVLKRFRMPHIKRIAKIMVGKPDDAFRPKSYETVLRARQEKLTANWHAQIEAKRRHKELQKQKAKAERTKRRREQNEAAETGKRQKLEAEAKEKGKDDKQMSLTLGFCHQPAQAVLGQVESSHQR